MKVCRESPNLVTIEQKYRTRYKTHLYVLLMPAKKVGHISTDVKDLIINFRLLTVTCGSTIHTEVTAAFPLLKWLHERTIILSCTVSR